MANESVVLLGPQPAGIGNKHVMVVKLVVDTYSEGGIAITLPSSITKPMVIAQASGGYVAEWDAENEKVLIYASAGTEVTTITSAIVVNVWFIGQ